MESPDTERNRLEQMVAVMLDLKRRINSEIVMRSTYQSQGSQIIKFLDFAASKCVYIRKPRKSENEDFREQENEKSKRKSQNEGEKSNWADFTFTGSGRIKLNDSNSTGTEHF